MRKVFILVCGMLLAVQFVAAQRNLYVISKEGELAIYSAKQVLFNNDYIKFDYGEVTSLTKDSFRASVKVAFSSEEYKSFARSIEVGVCYSAANTTPTINDSTIKLGTTLDEYAFTIKALSSGTTYYYRPYIKVNKAILYGEVCTETTFGEKSH